MKKYIILISSILILGTGCSSTSKNIKVNKIPPKKTFVKNESNPLDKLETVEGIEISPSEAKSLETLKTETITSTNSNSNSTSYSIQKPLTYKNDFGGDFGYFDEYGYYYNGCYFHYGDGYTYQDRLHRRGRFNPRVRHIRVCGEDYDNGNGYYYLAPDSYTIKRRPVHPIHAEERFIGSGSYSGLSYDEKK
jgi:hypothetical protein